MDSWRRRSELAMVLYTVSWKLRSRSPLPFLLCRTKIRSRVVGVPVVQSTNLEAAYGSAILALNGYRKFKSATDREAQTGDLSNSETATTN